MATISSQAENDEIAGYVAGARAWLGFNDLTTEGTWVRETGEPVTYTNWAPGEPNDYKAGGATPGVKTVL